MKIDYFIGYCVVTVINIINILWTGGVYIALTMYLHDILSVDEGDDNE